MRTQPSLLHLRGLAVVLGLALTPRGLATPQSTPPHIPGLHHKHVLNEVQVGSLLRHELRCHACHDGSSGIELPETPAPRLDGIGSRVTPAFLDAFLTDPSSVVPGTRMPHVLTGVAPNERDAVARALAAFLRSRSEAPFSDETVDGPDVADGRNLFHSVGCIACHASAEHSALADGVQLAHVASKWSLPALGDFLFQPRHLRPSGRMPDMQLTRSEARQLASYLLGEAERASPTPTKSSAEQVQRGREHFVALRCGTCHPLEGVPAPAAVPAISPDRLAHGCLSEAPSEAPDFRLSDAQRQAIRSSYRAPSTEQAPADRIDLTLTAFNCIGCHERGETGGVPQAKHEWYTTTQPDLGNEARFPPQLTDTGAKLRPEWMHKVLFDGASVRPYMHARMPQYGEEHLSHLPALFTAVDQMEQVTVEIPQGDATKEARDTGRLLLGDKGLTCISCHNFNGKPSPTYQGMDLIGSFERLQPSWFHAYMLKPQALRPGTVMPSYWPKGKTAFPELLNGDTDAQIAALWYVLSLGRSAPDPPGIRTPRSMLTVEETPILYRGRSRIAGFRGIAVGFPAGVHFAFNAETGALSGLWKGEFVSVNWNGQGAGDFQPANRAVELSQDLPLTTLEADDSPWPSLPTLDSKEPLNPDPLYPRRLGYRFKGYEFDDDWIPTLSWRVGDVSVSDRSTPVQVDTRWVLRRVLTLTTERPQTISFRILTGPVAPMDSGQFGIDGLQVHCGDLTTILRESPTDPAQRELLLPLTLPAGDTTVTLDYEVLR